MTSTHARLLFLLLGSGVLAWVWVRRVQGEFGGGIFASSANIKAYAFFLCTFAYVTVGSAFWAVAYPCAAPPARPAREPLAAGPGA